MKKNKILIVEDETNIADSVKLNLEAEGYEVEYTTMAKWVCIMQEH